MEPGAVFDRILQGADAGFQVGLKVEQPQMKVNVTPFRLSITSARAGRFYVLIHDTDREVRVLFPNLLQPDNQIRAGQTVTLPPNGSEVPFGEPVGAARLVAVVSSTPLDLAAATKRVDGDWKLLWQECRHWKQP